MHSHRAAHPVRPLRYLIACGLLAQLVLPHVGAAQIRLLKDIDQSTHQNPSSQPFQFVQMGGWTYFTAVYSEVGAAWFRTNGNPAATQLVKAIWPGPIKIFKNRMYFAVRDAKSGSELWCSDGTPAGTARVLDMMPGATDSSPSGFAELGGSLYFAANHPKYGRELFVTDGTAAGTKLVVDIAPGTGSSGVHGMVAIGKWIWFSADNGVRGAELWRSDGTGKGTVMVKDITSGPQSSGPAEFTPVGTAVCFRATTDGKSSSLFRTDGTATGTQELFRFMPWPSYPWQPTVTTLTAYGNRVLCLGMTKTQGKEVWITDGTRKGTRILKDLAPGTASGTSSGRMLSLGKHFYFVGDDGTRRGAQIWKSDGSASGTVPLAPNSPYGLGVRDMAVAGGRLFFAALSSTGGDELWVTDGTANGTALLRDIRPGASSSFPRHLTPIDRGRIAFQADDGKFGKEAWYSDGTTNGTVIAGDAYRPKSGSLSSYPRDLFDHNGVTFFRATTTATGSELWKTDGTPAGTVMVKDIHTGPGYSEPEVVGSVDDNVLLTAVGSNGKPGLWRSDGTAAKTVLVQEFLGRPVDSFQFRNAVFFVATTTAAGRGLWSSDGTTAGTRQLMKITRVNRPIEYASIGRIAYFTIIDYGYKLTLWRTDGTPTGTTLVKDLGRTWTKLSPLRIGITQLHALGNRLIFQGFGELWTSDGTFAGTKLLADLNRTYYSIPEDFTTVGNTVFFTADDGVHGYELWKTDGTTAGTVRVKDIKAGSGSSLDGSFYRINLDDRYLLFSADDGVSGAELWRSDGTKAGTIRVADIHAGRNGSGPFGFAKSGSRFVTFIAGTSALGRELWSTDGTTAGTTLVQDYNRGPGSGGGVPLLSGGRMIFAADDGVIGSELVALDLRALAIASSQPRGYPCGVSGNPTLRATDPVLGGTLRVSGRGAASGTRGVLVMSLPTAPVPIGGCQLDVDPAALFFLAVGVRQTGGAWSRMYPVANSPALLGLGVVLQAGFGPTAWHGPHEQHTAGARSVVDVVASQLPWLGAPLCAALPGLDPVSPSPTVVSLARSGPYRQLNEQGERSSVQEFQLVERVERSS